MGQDELKRAAGEAAVRHIEPLLTRDAVVGVGTGSTANCFIHALTRVRDRFAATVASSEASARLLRELGFPVLDLNEAPELAVYVDGADEADRWLQLVKGGGGALTREKILASATAVFVCIADESKLVDRLGRFPLPVEVIPMAVELVSRRLARLPCRPRLRPDFVTDNGNRILDLLDLEIDDAPRLEREPNDIPGIVTNGLFALRPADRLLLAGASGITELARA